MRRGPGWRAIVVDRSGIVWIWTVVPGQTVVRQITDDPLAVEGIEHEVALRILTLLGPVAARQIRCRRKWLLATLEQQRLEVLRRDDDVEPVADLAVLRQDRDAIFLMEVHRLDASDGIVRRIDHDVQHASALASAIDVDDRARQTDVLF